VTEKVKRNYLEISSLKELKEGDKPTKDYSLNLIDPVDFQLNKFFYKNIGKKHKWIDRLVWSEEKWINYVSSKEVNTYVLKYKNDLVGFFESIMHQQNNEIEIAYFGILEEYQNKQLGSYLLSEAIKESFHKKNIKRVWLHTCSLDHKNALKNYLARGMRIFKTEIINI
tara:strand:+ start:284 stop:790 length:507 start_codon:yes stop_codon:yes gene_type:complete